MTGWDFANEHACALGLLAFVLLCAAENVLLAWARRRKR